VMRSSGWSETRALFYKASIGSWAACEPANLSESLLNDFS
jgi:hypothetical protein